MGKTGYNFIIAFVKATDARLLFYSTAVFVMVIFISIFEFKKNK